MSCLDLLPPFLEERDFRFSTDQGCESPYLSHIQAAGGTTFTDHLVYVHGLSDATQGLCSQVLALEIALNEAVGRFTHRYRIRCCESFDARTDAGNLTQCQVFVPPCPAHFPNNNQPRMNAYTDGELHTFSLLQPLIQLSHCSEDPQTRSYCSMSVIFMGVGIPKVDQETIP